MPIKIALTGNPNCGKTTLFNHYTGAAQYVGNWAGVTVEKKEGALVYDGESITLTDLPGIYSLSPYSMEEVISRDYIVQDKPDAVIDVVDGTNLERNLYLTVQLLELEVPVVVAVNMMDEVAVKGDLIDCGYLGERLGVPVVPVSARRKENTGRVLEAAIAQARKGKTVLGGVRYDSAAQQAVGAVLNLLFQRKNPPGLPLQFFAGKLLESDSHAVNTLGLTGEEQRRVDEIAAAYEKTAQYGDRETMLADARYRYITGLCEKAVRKNGRSGALSTSDRIDSVLTNRVLAIPIFLMILFLIFSATFGVVGEWLKNLTEAFFDKGVAELAVRLLERADAPLWTRGLILDAVIGGVGRVVSFLPQVSILFFFLSVLEDSGYMARAAFIMDRLLRRIGLTGKSFIPMLMGFGCTTPAVMAARATDSQRDHRLTVMITPFMSCGAKLPVYALFASVFFPAHKGLVVFSMYVIGILTAILGGLLLKNTLLRGEAAPFVMELPPYRMPSASALALHVWEKAKGFLIKAGTVIFSMSILIWLLQNFDYRLRLVADNSDSVFAALGRLIAPLFTPLGFGVWQASVSVLAGLVAKEAVISSMTVLYGASGQGMLESALLEAFTPLSAYSFMVFCLLYTPCISAFVAIRRELGSMKWAAATAAFNTGAAYLISMLVYQAGRLIF